MRDSLAWLVDHMGEPRPCPRCNVVTPSNRFVEQVEPAGVVSNDPICLILHEVVWVCASCADAGKVAP